MVYLAHVSCGHVSLMLRSISQSYSTTIIIRLNTVMSVLPKYWRRQPPRVHDRYLFSQQEFTIKAAEEQGFVVVVDLREQGKMYERCKFPSLYKDYLGRIIHRRALYLTLWEHSVDPRLKSIPNFSKVFRHVRQLAEFTDRVVNACLIDADKYCHSPLWVPEPLREWLILEFHVGHGVEDVHHWLAEHPELSHTDPTEYGMYKSQPSEFDCVID